MYKEIMAKTLLGKGKLHQILNKEIFISELVSKLLGCWIINLEYAVESKDKKTFLNGKYDIQLWYAKDNDQKSEVYVESISFNEEVAMFYNSIIPLDNELTHKVYVERYPVCNMMELKDDKKIELQIESSFYVHVFQNSLLFVECTDNVEETITLEDEINMNVNPNYLTSKVK